MTSKEKFLTIVSKEQTNTLEKNSARIKNRAMFRESQQIAIKVLKKLDELGWSQKDLSKEMKVSPQQVNKIVKGQENLTLETQIKLQNILGIPILASYYEAQMNKLEEWILTIEKKVMHFNAVANQFTTNYKYSKTFKMECNTFSNEYSYTEAV